MKQSQIKKIKSKRHSRVRMTFEPDYDSEFWLDETVTPTPETHPDAFYRVETVVYPHPSPANVRREPHKSLSKRQLSKRLYQTGLKDGELKRVLAEILAGPALHEMEMGLTALGWNVATFRKRFGRRIAKVALKFVRKSLIALDEGWNLMSSPAAQEHISKGLTTMRKFGIRLQETTQTIPA